jgi:hypothetical protein
VYFRYFDATAQTEFLCWALQRMITHDLDQKSLSCSDSDRASKALGSEMIGGALLLAIHPRGATEWLQAVESKRSAHFVDERRGGGEV